ECPQDQAIRSASRSAYLGKETKDHGMTSWIFYVSSHESSGLSATSGLLLEQCLIIQRKPQHLPAFYSVAGQWPCAGVWDKCARITMAKLPKINKRFRPSHRLQL